MKTLISQKPLVFLAIVCCALVSCSKHKDVTPATPKTYQVTTLAGNTTAGKADGTGIAASFTDPAALAVNSSGALYIGDWGNNLIRQINTTSGAVVTVAGTGAPGFLDGAALSATLYGPANIAFDKSGNLFISDEQNNAIRELTTAGQLVTVAGTGVAGYLDGPVASAMFDHPDGIVVDASGNLYVADNATNVIRKIDMTAHTVSTYSGIAGTAGLTNGAAASAVFNNPYGMAMDASGNIYVADVQNNCIRKINTYTNTVSTFAGAGTIGFANGTASAATFHFPIAMAFDSQGNMYISDFYNNAIRKVDTNGNVTTFAGTGTAGSSNGVATSATFDMPIGIAVDGNGNVYVADEHNNMIRKISVNSAN